MIDFHAHLDLYPDPQATARECVARNLYVLSVTTTPSAWNGTKALAASAPRIRTALGLHPQLAHERKTELRLFERFLPETKYVGEVGLDGGSEYRQYWNDQKHVFTEILKLCRGVGGRIMTLHSRRAAGAVLDELETNHGAGTPILHWFSGTQNELRRAIDIGCWFSVGPAMLSSNKGRTLASLMPRDRLLTESDGPFAQMDGASVQPWDVAKAIQALSQIWRETPETTEQLLLDNFRRLTSIAV